MPNRREAVRRSHFGWSLHQVNYLIRGTATVQQPPCGSAEWVSLTLRQACSRENPGSAMCVQNLDDSRGLAIRITYHISLRPSSLWEPRHPLLKVVRHSRLVRGRLSLVTEVSHAETHSLFLQIVWSMPVMLKRSARLHLLLLLE